MLRGDSGSAILVDLASLHCKLLSFIQIRNIQSFKYQGSHRAGVSSCHCVCLISGGWPGNGFPLDSHAKSRTTSIKVFYQLLRSIGRQQSPCFPCSTCPLVHSSTSPALLPLPFQDTSPACGQPGPPQNPLGEE